MPGWRKPAVFLGIGVVLLGAMGYMASTVRWEGEGGLQDLLAAIVQPQVDLIQQSAGLTQDGKGIEYVVFLKEEGEMEKLKDFTRSQSDYRFIQEGFFGDSAVIAVNNGRTGLDYIRDQAWVSMVIRNRGLFFCH